MKLNLRELIKEKKVQYFLVFLIVVFIGMFFINPTRSALPYQIPSDSAQRFNFENCAIYQSFTVNCTVPEGDILYNSNNTLGWQLEKIRYKVGIDFNIISLDADEPSMSYLPLDSRVGEFSDENWFDSMFDLSLEDHFIPSAESLQSFYFCDQYKGEQYDYTPLGETLQVLNLDAQTYSGYRAKASSPSPKQMAVFFCNSMGYTYHNTTAGSTTALTGFNGLRPDFVTEVRSVPCTINYNLSTSNPVLLLTPANETQADLFGFGIMDICTPKTVMFEHLDKETNQWTSEGFWQVLQQIFMGGWVSAGGIFAHELNKDLYLTQCAKVLSEASAVIAKTYYDKGADDMANGFKLQLYEMQEALNLSNQQVEALTDMISDTNTWTKGNFTNPYLIGLPYELAINDPLAEASQFNIVILIIGVTITIVVIIIVVILIGLKIRRGNKKRNNLGSSGSSGKSTVIVTAINILQNLKDFLLSAFQTGFTGV